tara:strand:+ start:613 stop:954 length:342 start_codon:yes stop_codon:yes gene_type:complete
MALMHPMYNHQGKSRKFKRKKSQSLLAAEKKHTAWLKSRGLDKKVRRKPQTMITVDYHTEKPIEEKKTFIQPNWSPCVKKPKRETDKTYTVAIAYNKGAYQVISPKDIKDIGK